MSYAYELIKHNQVRIFREGFSSPTQKDNSQTIHLLGHYVDKPDISLSSSWDEDERFADRFIAQAQNVSRSLGTAFEVIGNVTGAGIQGGARAIDAGISGGKNRVNDLKDAVVKASDEVIKALQGTGAQRNAPVYALQWKRSDPISFSIDVIFINSDNSPIYPDREPLSGNGTAIASLLNAVAPSSIGGKGMIGPGGYNGFTAGLTDVNTIIAGRMPGLVTLELIQNGKTVMYFDQFLVIDNVSLSTSEQLYTDFSGNNSSPGYKWVKATISFRGATALPSAGSNKYNNNVSNLLFDNTNKSGE